MRKAPPILSGVDIEDLLKGYTNKFGAAKEKVKKGDNPFKKTQYFMIFHIGVTIHFMIFHIGVTIHFGIILMQCT